LESNWRFRLWDVGWDTSVLQLAARVVQPFHGYTHVAWRRFGLTGTLLGGVADVRGYVANWALHDFLLKFPGYVAPFIEPDNVP